LDDDAGPDRPRRWRVAAALEKPSVNALKGIHSAARSPGASIWRALVAGRDWRSILIWIAVAFAVLEVATVVLINVVAAVALPFAALFVLGAYWIRRGGSGGVVLVGAMCLVEAVFVPVYTRTSVLAVVLQAAALALGIAGVAVAILAFRGRRVAAST
jgi:hypothetical protein